MCTDIVYRGHIVACVNSNAVRRVDNCTFDINGVRIEFWDDMHMTVIGDKSVLEIPPDGDVTHLIERKNKLQNQIELLSDLVAQTQKQITKGESKNERTNLESV